MTPHCPDSRRRRLILRLPWLCLLAALAMWTFGPVRSAAAESIVLPPVADATIDSSQRSVNFGTAETLLVGLDVDQAARGALLRFDLAGLPAGAVVEQAALRLYQNAPAGQPWVIDLYRPLSPWEESSVTFVSQPQAELAQADLPVPLGANQYHTYSLTSLVRSWVHEPLAVANFGLLLRPGDASLNGRSFGSRESANPPQLVVDYSVPPSDITVQNSAPVPQLDGVCEANGEYAGANVYRYADVDGEIYPIYLLQTFDDLYVCVQGVHSVEVSRFTLALDLDRSAGDDGNPIPSRDDFRLELEVSTNFTLTLQGTGSIDVDTGSAYIDSTLDGWQALGSDGAVDSAEFRVPVSALRHPNAGAPTYSCNNPIGVGVYHRSLGRPSQLAGWPLLDGPDNPPSWVTAQLENPNCPIRVCVADGEDCSAAIGATVYRTGDRRAFAVGRGGFLLNRAVVQPGDQLWALYPIQARTTITPYAVSWHSGAAQEVNPAAFDGPPSGVMTLVVSETFPLIVHDLTAATQWALSPAQQISLTRQLTRASELLYDFTDGQFILGTISVTQNYEGWDEANLWIYAHNNLHPKATAGGVVAAPLQDPDNDVTYFPGHIHQGSYWNRFNRPEGEPILINGVPFDPSLMVDDWSLALAHEFGHYGLFLFDTYFGVGPDLRSYTVESCTGSAMGTTYDAENWGFVYDPVSWAANCGNTAAHQLLGRDEWATLLIHYPWLQRPDSFVPGPAGPPIPLTQVNIIAPSTPVTPLENQTFDLLYDNGETAGRKAMAFLMRDDRVINQGNPPKGGTQITLNGAQAGDRFCVYDIDASPPAPNSPRHQYGCEFVADGDNDLDLERDPDWRPIVLVDPTSSTSLAISVTQPLAGASLVAQVYREHAAGMVSVPLNQSGTLHTGNVTLPGLASSAYVQVFVDEPAEETNPRREAMAMYGVDGGTVPGPSSWNPKAPVISPDGHSTAWPPEDVEVQANQWASMEYMVATYPDPEGSTRVSDAYRVTSWPRDLASEIIVTIDTGTYPQAPRAASASATVDEPVLRIRYWDGTQWRAVPTQVSESGEDGRVASAIVPTFAVYALFSGEDRQYLPAVVN